MHEWQSLSHVKWECKYHVVIVPKYRRKVFYGRLRKEIGAILRELCRQRGVLFPTTFWSFRREFWTPSGQAWLGRFVGFPSQSGKLAIMVACPQRLALNENTTIVFKHLFKRLAT